MYFYNPSYDTSVTSSIKSESMSMLVSSGTYPQAIYSLYILMNSADQTLMYLVVLNPFDYSSQILFLEFGNSVTLPLFGNQLVFSSNSMNYDFYVVG